MNKKGISFIEILSVIVLITLIASFFSVKLFHNKKKQSEKKTLEWIYQLTLMAQRKAQRHNKDVYLVFIPAKKKYITETPQPQQPYPRSPYLKRKTNLLGHALAIATYNKKKGLTLVQNSQWHIGANALLFSHHQKNNTAKIFTLEKKEEVPLHVEDITGAHFTLSVPAIRFLKQSGHLSYPSHGHPKKLFISIQGDSSYLEIDPFNNHIQWKEERTS